MDKLRNRPSLKRAAVFVSVGLPILLMTTVASATSASVSTAITSGFGSLKGLIIGVIAVAAFAITVAGVGISLGLKWLRSKSKAAS